MFNRLILMNLTNNNSRYSRISSKTISIINKSALGISGNSTPITNNEKSFVPQGIYTKNRNSLNEINYFSL